MLTRSEVLVLGEAIPHWLATIPGTSTGVPIVPSLGR